MKIAKKTILRLSAMTYLSQRISGLQDNECPTNVNKINILLSNQCHAFKFGVLGNAQIYTCMCCAKFGKTDQYGKYATF